MDTKPPGRTRRAQLTLAIGAANLARDVSIAVPPARVAFAAIRTLLIMISVSCLLFCDHEFLVHAYVGLYGKRQRLCQAWINLR